MKMKPFLMALAFCAGTFLTQPRASAAATMRIVPAASPQTNSPSVTQWKLNAMHYLKTGQILPGSRETDATVYEPILNNSLQPKDITGSANAPIWLGTLNRPGFGAERGHVLQFGLVITNDQPFKMEQVRLTLTSTDTFVGTNSLKYVRWFKDLKHSATTLGKYWGADGIQGTADDKDVDSGDPNQPINVLITPGSGNGYRAETQNAIDNIVAYMAQQPRPFSIVAMYELLDPLDSTIVLKRAITTISVSPLTPPPAPLVAINGAAGTIGMNVSSNCTYYVQRTADIANGPWENRDCLAQTNSGPVTVTYTHDPSWPREFIRVVVNP